MKVEHQKPSGLTHVMNVPTWKWEEINMEFVVSLPRTRRQNVSIWVVKDRLTSHFIPVKSTYSAEEYAKLYVDDIVSFHGSICPLYQIEVLN